MIDVKQAVEAVTAYTELFPKLLPVESLRLEEFEYDHQLDEWFVTVSVSEEVSSFELRKTYRVFRVDGTSGKVLSMKLRNPNERV